MAVAVPALVVGLAEVGLRLAGLGYPTSFFLPRTINGRPVWVENWQFGWRFFPRPLARSPYPLVMARDKPVDTLRIFVLGESAALGVPAPEFGFGRMLEVLLQDRLPQRKVEVINVSMVAINSHVVRVIADECARCQGDLWVIYMGNNEVIGPFGAHAVLGPAAPPGLWVRATVTLKTSRLVQLLDAALQALSADAQQPSQWQGMRMWRAAIGRADPRIRRVQEHFRANLRAILRTAHQAGTPVVLCTVGCNLRDCSPFASLHRAGLTPEQQASWEQAYQAAWAAETNGLFDQAVESYRQALQTDDQFAELHFRLGRCYLALGQTNEARLHFQRAKDQDALQFRPDSRLNEILRQEAGRFDSVRLLDAETLFAQHSPDGIPGRELFYEHVHLTPTGNYLLARAVAELAETMLAGRLGDGTPAGPAAWLSQAECEQRLGLMDWGRLQMLEFIQELICAPPFPGQSSHSNQVRRLHEDMQRLRLARSTPALRAAVRQVQAAVQRRPQDPELLKILAPLLEAVGDAAGAEQCWRRVTELTPQAAVPYLNLALLLRRQGRDLEAIQAYRECLHRNTDHAEAHGDLGALLLQHDQPEAALPHLRFLVRRQPESVAGRWLLTQALLRTGRRAEARRQAEAVLRLNPNHPEAKRLLEQLQTGR